MDCPSRTAGLSRWASLAVVTLLAVLPFLPTVHNRFIWDDHDLVENNPALDRPLASFGELVSFAGYRSPYYRPLSVLMWSGERALFGFDARGYHLANILLHAVASVLVLLIAGRRLSPWAALLGAGVFAVHPVHVEPVAFISAGATELLPSMLFLAALVALWPPGDPEEIPGITRAVSAGVLFLLALLSKEVSIVLPVVAVVMLWPPRSGAPRAWSILRSLLPCLVALIVYGVLRLRAMNAVSELPMWGAMRPMVGYIPAWVLAVARLMVFPHPLLPYHELPAFRLPLALLAGLVLVLGCAAAVGLGEMRRFDRAFRLGFALLVVPLLPTLPLLPRAGALLAERFLYLPSAGLSLLAAAGMDLLIERRGRRSVPLLAAFAVLLLGAAAWTSLRSGDWRDEYRLFSRAVSRDPDNIVLNTLLGEALMREGRVAEAEAPLVRARELWPGFDRAGVQLADVYRRTGRIQQARELYEQMLAASPGDPGAHFGLGTLEMDHGDPARAAAELEEAIRLNPGTQGAHVNLGVLDYRAGRDDRAEEHWLRALKLKPRDAAVLNNLGAVAQNQGRFNEAREYFKRALEIDPGHKDARKNMEALPH